MSVSKFIIGADLDIATAFKDGRDMNMEECLKVLQSPIMIYWSWGVSSVRRVGTKALVLRVSGHHHKGLVFVRVSGLDLYDVIFTTLQHKVKDVKEGLYFDQLQEIIDLRVEKIAAYQF